MEEKRSKILQIIDSRTKVMALISIIAEALFLGSLVTLPSDQTLYALIACLSILIVTLIGITIIEYTEVKSTKALIENKDSTFLPEDIRGELNLSFIAKRDKLSKGQREILSYIEKNATSGGGVSQKHLEGKFSKHTGCYVYWRLEVLRYLGFVRKIEIGKNHNDTPLHSYVLTAEYKKKYSGHE
ncbi:Uncharacterized protein DENIS_2962 [Desulfonema ishimotonii]|uniref:Uncharacterized protein n=1 Tax=Desulfonema ishimotonii TaxID=45657 RepID=A0A401FYF3_9BACT|nr:Uncharacterized protein DENIS_2962 [Desulfonema ishimotonii]